MIGNIGQHERPQTTAPTTTAVKLLPNHYGKNLSTLNANCHAVTSTSSNERYLIACKRGGMNHQNAADDHGGIAIIDDETTPTIRTEYSSGFLEKNDIQKENLEDNIPIGESQVQKNHQIRSSFNPYARKNKTKLKLSAIRTQQHNDEIPFQSTPNSKHLHLNVGTPLGNNNSANFIVTENRSSNRISKTCSRMDNCISLHGKPKVARQLTTSLISSSVRRFNVPPNPYAKKISNNPILPTRQVSIPTTECITKTIKDPTISTSSMASSEIKMASEKVCNDNIETNLYGRDESRPHIAPNHLNKLRNYTHLSQTNNYSKMMTLQKSFPNPVLFFGSASIVSIAELWERFVYKANIEIVDNNDTPEQLSFRVTGILLYKKNYTDGSVSLLVGNPIEESISKDIHDRSIDCTTTNNSTVGCTTSVKNKDTERQPFLLQSKTTKTKITPVFRKVAAPRCLSSSILLKNNSHNLKKQTLVYKNKCQTTTRIQRDGIRTPLVSPATPCPRYNTSTSTNLSTLKKRPPLFNSATSGSVYKVQKTEQGAVSTSVTSHKNENLLSVKQVQDSSSLEEVNDEECVIAKTILNDFLWDHSMDTKYTYIQKRRKCIWIVVPPSIWNESGVVNDLITVIGEARFLDCNNTVGSCVNNNCNHHQQCKTATSTDASICLDRSRDEFNMNSVPKQHAAVLHTQKSVLEERGPALENSQNLSAISNTKNDFQNCSNGRNRNLYYIDARIVKNANGMNVMQYTNAILARRKMLISTLPK